MKRNQHGFGLPEIIIIVVVAGLVAILCWNLVSNKIYPNTKGAPVSQSAGEADGVIIRLIDKTTKKPLVNREVTFRSNNGLECVTEPCPSNDQRVVVRTDGNGEFVIARSYIQTKNYIELPPYSPNLFYINDTQTSAIIYMSPTQ